MKRDTNIISINGQKIITLIAEIQKESLLSLQKNIHLDEDYKYIRKLVESQSEDKDEINLNIEVMIKTWTNISNYPNWFLSLPRYQLMISSHILYEMEDIWITDNPEGVVEVWAVLKKLLLHYLEKDNQEVFKYIIL